MQATGAAVRADRVEPLYFPSGYQQLFGWLHHPSAADASGWGVVICKPFGYEALCAHRSIRAFADAAAALGMPVLLFDYLGTGDSADIDPPADQIEAWTRDIAHAVTELRRRTAVAHVCLLGFRLGALLAMLAAEQCQAEALALVAPVTSGRKYLREARTALLAAQAAEAAQSPSGEAAAIDPEVPDGGMEVSGYLLSAATSARLSRTDAAAVALAGVSGVLLIDRSDLPVARAWSQTLEAAGVRTEYHSLPGFVEMMVTAPHLAVISQQMLARTREWLSRLRDLARANNDTYSPTHTSPGIRVPQPESESKESVLELELPGEDGSPRSSLTERPLFVDADAHTLFGIVTEPRRDETRRRAVIFLNTGADHHIGASRMYVSLGRNWARRGYHVLRMDLSGLGDSPARAGRADNEVFPAAAISDIRCAVEYMRAHYRCGEVTLLGLCSGAYHAFRAAAAKVAVNRILMVNPETFFWPEGASVRDIQLADLVNTPTVYRERALSLANWRRLLTGQVDVGYIGKLFLRRLLFALQFRGRDLMRLFGLQPAEDLGRELERIAARGVRMVMVFAKGEPGIEVLRLEGGSAVGRLGDRLLIRIIDSGDHTFSRSGPRQVLEKVLSEEILTRPGAREDVGIARADELRSA
jgi:alpha-beta hydrolase superfamily lysophospholipase